jgi:branched-chain amino acid transport system permease protein
LTAWPDVGRPDHVGWFSLGGVATLALLPLVLGPYPVIVLTSALALTIACLAMNLLLGSTGLLSFGHGAFLGIGAYTGGFLFTFGDTTSFEVYLVSGVLAATLCATAFGVLWSASTSMYFSILTLAFGQAVHTLFVNGAVFRPFGPMGKGFFLIGHGGLYLPRFTMLGAELDPEQFSLVLYYVVLACLVASGILLWRVEHSPFGTSLRAIRDNATRAACIGIPVERYRWAAVVISGMFTGLAGALLGQVDRQVTPQQLDWLSSAQLVVACILGGTRYFFGPVVGAFVIVALKELSLRFPLAHHLVLGVLLIVIIRTAPGGLVSLITRVWIRVGSALVFRVGQPPSASMKSDPR